MAETGLPAAAVAVTVLFRDECPACAELLGQLRDFAGDPSIDLQSVDLGTTAPPPYAQGVIVPATYIGEQLWRYGVYSAEEFAARLAAERSPAGPEGDSPL